MPSHLSITLKKVIAGLFCLLVAFPAISQLSVGSSGSLSIINGTTFSTDSLILIPSVDLTVSSNSIVKGATPVPSLTPGASSIARTYVMGAPITFSGNLGIIYRDGELGTNTEALLQVAYFQSVPGAWITSAGSTINTGTNYVNNTFSLIPIAAVTATTAGVTLPLIQTAFSAQLNDQYILVNWKIEATEQIAGFNLESSTDGKNWKTTAYVPAIQGQESYDFQDADLNFSIRYYRIGVSEVSGKIEYSTIVMVRKPNAAIALQIVSGGGGRTINFQNATPEGIQLYDINGRLLKQMNTPQQSYNVGSLPTGVYILRFKVASEENVRKIFLP